MVVPVNLGKNSYDVVIERGGLSRAEKEFDLERKVLIVTDSGVPFDYAGLVSKKCAFSVVAVINSGEENKTLETMQTLFSAMVKNGFTRKDAVVADLWETLQDLWRRLICAGLIFTIFRQRFFRAWILLSAEKLP